MTRPPRAAANRFLDHDLLDNPTRARTAQARIRGLETQGRVETWRSVELALDRGPRQQVIAWLNHRQQVLDTIGDQPEDLSEAPRADRNPPDREWVWIGVDGEDRAFDDRPTRADVGGHP